MKKKLVVMFSALLLTGTLTNVGTAYANNYGDTTFKFRYNAIGSDVSIEPREKTDSTASYVKLTSNSIDLMVYVSGTNDKKDYNALLPHMCSNVVLVPKGDYKYISNTVFGKYKYAYLCMGSDIKGMHWVEGRWSPDNISGRY